jgi:hypothetical protein
VSRLPRYLRLAKAEVAGWHGDAAGAIRGLRDAGNTRRGLSDNFYRRIAQEYQELVEAGEKYPVKTLAAMQPVHISTASRWITEAKRRGLIAADTPQSGGSKAR